MTIYRDGIYCLLRRTGTDGIVIAKFDSTTGVSLWEKPFFALPSIYISALYTSLQHDSTGIYIAGTLPTSQTIGTTEINFSTPQMMFAAKIDFETAESIWVFHPEIISTTQCLCLDMVADDNYLYAIGTAVNDVSFGDGLLPDNSQFIVKLDKSNGSVVWTNYATCTASAVFSRIDTDSSNFVYIGGESSGSLPEWTIGTNVLDGGLHTAIIKVDKSDGSFTSVYSGIYTGSTKVRDIVVKGSYIFLNLYVSNSSTLTFPDLSAYTVNVTSSTCGLIVGFNLQTESYLWITSISIDQSGPLYVLSLAAGNDKLAVYGHCAPLQYIYYNENQINESSVEINPNHYRIAFLGKMDFSTGDVLSTTLYQSPYEDGDGGILELISGSYDSECNNLFMLGRGKFTDDTNPDLVMIKNTI